MLGPWLAAQMGLGGAIHASNQRAGLPGRLVDHRRRLVRGADPPHLQALRLSRSTHVESRPQRPATTTTCFARRKDKVVPTGSVTWPEVPATPPRAADHDAGEGSSCRRSIPAPPENRADARILRRVAGAEALPDRDDDDARMQGDLGSVREGDPVEESSPAHRPKSTSTEETRPPLARPPPEKELRFLEAPPAPSRFLHSSWKGCCGPKRIARPAEPNSRKTRGKSMAANETLWLSRVAALLRGPRTGRARSRRTRRGSRSRVSTKARPSVRGPLPGSASRR